MLFLILFILGQITAKADDDMVSTTQRAILSYSIVQKYQTAITNKIHQKLPIPKEYVAPLATVTITFLKGKIDTKSLKSNYKILGGDLRPDAFYDLRTKETKGILTFILTYP